MRYRVLPTIVLIAVVQVSLTLGIWWAGRPSTPVAVAHVDASAPAPSAFPRLAELYASAAFRSVITFDYAALGELVARSATWPEVLYVSVEDQNGKILAHSDRSKIGGSWQPWTADELKARYGDAYREVAAPMTDGRPSGAASPNVGQVRLAYSGSAAPPPLTGPPVRRDRFSLGILLGAAALLAVPVGLLVSGLRDSGGRGYGSARDAKERLELSQLTRDAEQHRAVAADYIVRLSELRAELAERSTHLADAENEIALLREHAVQQGDAAQQVHAELQARTTDLGDARTALRGASETIAELETRLQRGQLLEAELADLRRAVEEDDQLRQRQRRAIAYIAHEVRSSLTKVLGFSKVLLRGTDGTLSDTQRASALNIQTAGDQLLTVVNDVVDLTQIEDGAVALKPDLVDVRKLLDGTAAAAIRLGRGAGDVLVECPSTLPLLKVDRSRAAQILATLVEQAPESATVVLRARDTRERVEVTVSGPPTAAPRTLDELCEPFPPTNTGAPIQDSGRRLRLAVARHLTLASGGNLSLQHDEAATTFTLTLPTTVDALTFA